MTPKPEDINKRLDRWLRQQHPGLTQGQIEKSLRKGLIRVNNTKVTSSYRLQEGDDVDVRVQIDNSAPHQQPLPPKPLSAKEIDELKSWIIWEDDDLLVLNKPSGLATQGGTKTTRHVDGLLQAYGQKTNIKYRLTHRLDRDTSGILLIAKSSRMASHLTQAFRDDQIQKTYLALVVGDWREHQGTIHQPIKKAGKIEKMIPADDGLPATTHFRLLKHLGHQMTLLRLKPETGRTHQLRVHLQHKGFPIVGDGKYGGRDALKHHDQLMLHAFEIAFKDLEGATMVFRAPLPPHFKTLLDRYEITVDLF